MCKNIVVLVSGGGTNLQALIDAQKRGELGNGKITCVISSKADAYALTRAENNGIKTRTLIRKDFNDIASYSCAMRDLLIEEKADLIVYAGFMTILDENVCDAFQNKMINVHPALIPSFCGKGFYGLHVHEEALKKGFKEATNDSWVNSEKDAKELLLAARIFKIEELEKINNKTMTGQSTLNSQKRKLAKLLETYPKLKESLDENGNLKDDVRIKAKNFEDSKRKAVILSKYMKDLSFKKEFSREDFDEYTNVEKRDYYRMALIGLEYAEENNDPVLKKLALRRFENLNTDELKFITINEDGSYKLNEKVIVDEYNKINSATTYDNLYDLRRKLVAQYNETNVSGRLEEMIKHGIEPIENMADMSLEEKYSTIMEMRERANAKSVAKKQQDKLQKHEYMLKMTEKKKAEIVSQNKSRQENNDQEMYEESRDEGETKVNEEPESIIEFENTDKSLWSKVKDFVKQKILRNNQLRLPEETGKKEDKKEGFFAKLFGALKDDNSKNNNSKEKSVIKLESKMDAYKIENSDGRIEQGATESSNSNRDGTMIDNNDKSQMQMEDK